MRLATDTITDSRPGIYTPRTEQALASIDGFQYSLVHRTVFVYDALMAEEALEALLVPAGGETARVRAKRAAKVSGYGRYCMMDSPLPAALPAASDSYIEGLLLERLQPSEVRAIDAFYNGEPRQFDRRSVPVQVENGFGGHEEVEGLLYVCPPALAG